VLGESNAELVSDGENLTDRFTVSVPKGQTLTLDKHAAVYTNIERVEEDLVSVARNGLMEAVGDGFDALVAEQEAFWARHWAVGDCEIDGCPSDQQALRFSLFHLRQSAPKDGRHSIGANGLTGDKYCGHVFWDTEMYISPYLLYTDPATVRPLLMYRYHLLDSARQRAREMEGVGALYSWNSISGEECGVVYEAATAEYHLLCAIATAIARYVRQTGDEVFLRHHGAEIVLETARFFADRGKFIPARGGQFCINAVCGPDEYGCAVNNNCYTNTMVQWHFRLACRIHDRLRDEHPEMFEALAGRIGLRPEERETWQRAADLMYLPYSAELGIQEQDDSFLTLDPVDMSKVPLNTDIREHHHPLNLWRMQVAKQADVVLLMFVQGDQFSVEQKRANYDFYEPRTCHGSSLSACIHSIVASEIGYADHAYHFFHQSARMDIHDFKNNTAAGVHSACLGGTWLALVFGFGGMRDHETGLRFAPTLPAQWTGYRFQVLYQGSRIGVAVTREGATYRLVEGPAVRFESAGAEVALSPEKPEAKASLARPEGRTE
jgi:alpha,alpha-trehalose phosphorylase